MNENEIGTIIIDCAVQLHKLIGPGLFESVYEVLLARMIEEHGLQVDRQVTIPIPFKGINFKEGFRADVIVEKKDILELKSIEKICPAHNKQLLTYLKLSNLKLGYLLNFGAPLMKEGITRMINGTL